MLFSVLSPPGHAQYKLKSENKLSDSLSYRDNFDNFIKDIDKTRFSTSVLYDRVYPFAKLQNFNAKKALDTSNYTHFIQAYYELYLSSFSNSGLKQFTEIKNEVKTKNSKGIIPIGVINYDYNYLDSNAVKSNDFGIEGKHLQQKNAKATFVKKDNACVVSLLSGKLKPGITNIIFDNNFVYTNRGVKVKSIRMQLADDTADYIFTLGEIKAVTLKAGKTVVTYTLSLTDGKEITAYSQLDVDATSLLKAATVSVEPLVQYCDSVRIQSSLSYTDYTGVNKKGIGDMLIYYGACNDWRFKKPIIICDGFDPGDGRKGVDIYSMMNVKPYYLAENLRASGFDIIIVNFPEGADFIVRNAYTMIDVIKWVNQRKITSKKNIVVGPSMGGLITRYALAKMEKDGVDHQTTLWVSFDAPHQGANIAIGDQYFLDFFGRVINNAGANEGLAKINSPAAKQMLVDHYSKPWNNEAPECSWYRNSFLSELTSNGLTGSKGYPLNLRKAALINGSGVGTNQEGIDNYEYLLEMVKRVYGFAVASGQVKTAADNSFTRRWVLYAYCADPSYWTQRWSCPSTSPYFTTCYDKAPGGNYPTQNILAEGSSDFTVYYPSHSFIPSVSSLDLTDPYLTLNVSTANIIQNKRTPFDAYFAPSENQEHITFNSNSINWLNNEIYSAIPCNTRSIGYTTYSSNTSISDCKISLYNVTINNNANVVFDAESETSITGGFEVTLGSSVEIK